MPPFKNLPVSYQMKFSVYSQIVDYLRDKNIYDYIVVELSSELEADKLVFLKNCDWKVLLTTQDKIAVGKLEALLSNMLDFDRNILICVTVTNIINRIFSLAHSFFRNMSSVNLSKSIMHHLIWK